MNCLYLLTHIIDVPILDAHHNIIDHSIIIHKFSIYSLSNDQKLILIFSLITILSNLREFFSEF